MGEVFAAKRLGDGREVAIKVVSHRIVDDTLMARLEREAMAARRIKSIYVPEVFEVDRTEDGELYLVMRLLHGEPLSARIKERRALQWPEVEAIVDDVLSGLADAHAAGAWSTATSSRATSSSSTSRSPRSRTTRRRLLQSGLPRQRRARDDSRLRRLQARCE